MKNTLDITKASAKWLTLCAVCLAALAMPISFTGPAVALEAIYHDVGGTPLALSWATNAFMLSFGSTLLAAGALADSYGRKRLFLLGTGLFSTASLALACAPGIVAFDVFRAVQGVAASMAFSSGLAALAQEFDGEARTHVFSLIGTTFGVGLAFGPLLTGQLIHHLGWRALFVTTLGMGLVAGVAGACWMRETRDGRAAGLDWPGALSFTAALTFLTCGMLLVPEVGWGHAAVLGLLGAASVLLALFVAIELHVKKPMLDLSLFRYPRFVGVQFLAAAPAYAYVVLLVLLPIRLVGMEGCSEIRAGLVMLALSAPLVVVPFLAALLTRWMSAAVLSGLGLLICAGGLFWLGHFPQVSAIEHTWLPLALVGFGISLPWGLMDGLAVSVVPAERAGMAAGMFSTTRVAGEGIALAMVGAWLAMLIRQHLLPLPGMAALGESVLGSVASQAAMGHMSQALALLPPGGHDLLAYAYGQAFQTLLAILAVITVLSALVVFGFLRQPHAVAASGRGEACQAESGL